MPKTNPTKSKELSDDGGSYLSGTATAMGKGKGMSPAMKKKGMEKVTAHAEEDSLRKAAAAAVLAIRLPVGMLEQLDLAALRVEIRRQTAGKDVAGDASGKGCHWRP